MVAMLLMEEEPLVVKTALKVDRSGAYMARYLAKNIVASSSAKMPLSNSAMLLE